MQRSGQRMLFFLILILTIGVFGREIPECLRLEDDVSNDGAVALCLQEELTEAISLRRFPDTPLLRTSITALLSLSEPTLDSAYRPCLVGNKHELFDLLRMQRR